MPYKSVEEAIKEHPCLRTYSSKAQNTWLQKYNLCVGDSATKDYCTAISFANANEVDGIKEEVNEDMDSTRKREERIKQKMFQKKQRRKERQEKMKSARVDHVQHLYSKIKDAKSDAQVSKILSDMEERLIKEEKLSKQEAGKIRNDAHKMYVKKQKKATMNVARELMEIAKMLSEQGCW